MQIRRFSHIAILFLVVIIAAFETKAQANKKTEDFCAELKGKNLKVTSDEIFVTGEIFRPQKLRFKDELTVTQLIAMTGGLPRKANSKQIQIIKCSEDYKLESITILDYDKIKKGIEKDLKLEAGSIIVIPNKKQAIELISPNLISGEN